MKIAILGAESTGKSSLAQSLALVLESRATPAATISEALRDWCNTHARTPRPEEQWAIAQEQASRVDAATAQVVIADTTPLMTAVYSELLFGDTSLYPFALQHQSRYTLTLLTGLDLPWVADGIQRDSAQARARVDARLRQVLQQHALPHSMVYGTGQARTVHALQAMDHALSYPQPMASAETRWRWNCEKCSDPECEHRLFSTLVART